MNTESNAQKVYKEVLERTQGENFAISSSEALFSLEGLAYILSGEKLAIIERNEQVSGNFKSEKIFEIGSGFGTITRLLLILFSGPIICHELDPKCIEKLNEFRKGLSISDSERLIILNQSDYQLQTKFIKENLYGFYGIVVDGPIRSQYLKQSISQSPDLRFVFIEGYRLIQRAQISLYLYKQGLQQQYLEIRHNEKVTGAIFIVDNCSTSLFGKYLRSSLDFSLSALKLYPKLIRNVAQSKGRNLKVGSYEENGEGITRKIQ